MTSLDGFRRDLKFGLRSLRRAPVFSGAVVATIALCLGPNVAILTLLYALVLKPAPFHQPERLVKVVNVYDKLGGRAVRQMSSPSQFRDYLAGANLFEGFAAMQYFGTVIGEETTPERAAGMRVDAGFFPLFGVKPLLGRFATSDEEAAGRDHVLVLTESFWRSRYASDPGVVGRTIRMGGEPWTIIGVAPKSVEELDAHTMFFKPFESRPAEEDQQARFSGHTLVYARLKGGVSHAAAEAQLNGMERDYLANKASARQRAQIEPAGHRVVLEQLREAEASRLRSPLGLLEVGALFVLLIGVVNVINLLLARANAKRGELTIRQALGAGPGAIFRQVLAETLLLTGGAALVGLMLAWGSLQVINRYLPLVAAKTTPVGLESPVVVAILIGAVLLGVVLAVAHSVVLGRTRVVVTGSRTTSASPAARAFGHGLIVAQISVALVLLIGAGLLMRSFVRVLSVDLGFDAASVVQGRVAVPPAYAEPAKNVAFQVRIMDAFREIPGVEQVSEVGDYAVGSFRTLPFVLRAAPVAQGGTQPLAAVNWVSPDYFATLGIELLEGQIFTDSVDARKGQELIVDDLFARRYFPGRSAIGQEIAFGTQSPAGDTVWPRIVGVVRRAELAGPESRDGLPFIFGPLVHQPAPGITFLVRSPRPSGEVLAAMRQKLREIDPTMPLYWTASLQEGIDGMLQVRRGLLLLIAAFAALAVILAGVGLYGVLAYDVSQRTRELGIRGAIGATRAQLIGLVLRQGLWRAGFGLLAGLILACVLVRFLRTLLFDVAPWDPMTFFLVPVLMIFVAAVACWLPARRASKVDPLVALRAE